MVYEFGPDQERLLALGGGFVDLTLPLVGSIQVPNPVIFLLVLMVTVGLLFRWTRWGRYLFAIGGNERAATSTGVPVKRIKISVYMFSSLCAGMAGILEVGWLGTITTGLGQGMELAAIAAAVIGGANLMGGVGTAYGAVVGAALIEVIRNSLILLGISTFWQGTFVGTFIIVAALFDRLRSARGSD
jgi:ribose transport system permease protein